VLTVRDFGDTAYIEV